MLKMTKKNTITTEKKQKQKSMFDCLQFITIFSRNPIPHPQTRKCLVILLYFS